MEEKFDIFDSLKKTEKPTVPEGFFASFGDKLSSKLKAMQMLIALINLKRLKFRLDSLTISLIN